MKEDKVPSELLEKLKEKTGLKKRAIYYKFENKINEYDGSITLRIASFLVAKEYKINFRGFLTKEDREELRKAKSFGQPEKITQPKIIIKEVTKSIKSLKNISSIDPFLPPKLLDVAKEQAEKAYPLLYVFENSVRNVIKILMEDKFGKNWWDIRIKQKFKNIDSDVKSRMKAEKQNRWHLSRRGSDKIYYTDLDDLKKIIEDNWPIFKKIHDRQSWVIEHIMQLKYSRNIIAHNNPLRDRDIKSIETKIHEWLDQIKGLKI